MNSWSSKTIIHSGGSEKMMLKSKKASKREAQQKFRGPWVENLSFRHHKGTSFEALRPRYCNIPDPSDISRRNEPNSDKYKQCLWNWNQWQVDRSEGCQSFWGVACDSKIPDPTYKTSWRIQMGEWNTCEDPKDNQTGQYWAWSLDTTTQQTRRKRKLAE